MREISFLLFDGVELLDFAGPYEVFSSANQGGTIFSLATCAQALAPVTTANGVRLLPDRALTPERKCDILVIPGGKGTRREMQNDEMLRWVKTNVAKSEAVLSVCTGALLLGKAGLLDGLRATTHH